MKKIFCTLLIFLSSCTPRQTELAQDLAGGAVVIATLPITVPLITAAITTIQIQHAMVKAEDITNDPRAENLIRTICELEEDLFLFQHAGRKGYHLSKPGLDLALPASFEDYYLYPNDWQYKDMNAVRGDGRQHFRTKVNVLGVIEKGTRLKINKVLLKNSDYSVFVEADHPKWKGLPINIKELGWVREGIFVPYNTCKLLDQPQEPLAEEKMNEENIVALPHLN